MNEHQEPIRVLIADDDPGIRLVLRKVLEKQTAFTLLGEAEDGLALLPLVEQHRPELIFLDVEMPGMTGVECARVIQDTDPSILLVFATAHERYMGDAFEVYAFDYLLKPFQISRVIKTLGRVKTVLDIRAAGKAKLLAPPEPVLPTSDRLMLKGRDGVQMLNQQDILLIQREDRATALYTTGDQRYVTAEPLGELEKRLDPKLFFRSHKSYIVNLQAIDNITPYGRWTYIAKLKGTRQDALITRAKYDELEQIFA